MYHRDRNPTPLAAATLVCLVSLSGPLMITSSASAATPNIVLLMADDLGWGDTAYNGHPHLQTPSLDRMARDGLPASRLPLTSTSIRSRMTWGSVMK